MSVPTMDDVHKSSIEFSYEDILEEFWVDEACLQSLSMKRYQVYLDKGAQVEVTTYGDYWITRFAGENYFPLHVVIDVQRGDGTSLGRVEAEYQVCFYCFPIVTPEHFSRLMNDRILPMFWEFTGAFLCKSLEELGFDPSLLESQLPVLSRSLLG